MTGSSTNLKALHRSPPLGALAIVFTALFLGSIASQAIMTGGAPFPIPYSLAGCGKSKLGAWQPKHFDIELFYARRRHSTIDNVQLPVSGAASAGGSSTSGDSSDR